VAFPQALRALCQPKSAISSLLREFADAAFSSFFNTIGQEATLQQVRMAQSGRSTEAMASERRGRADAVTALHQSN
jgi:hypothetical protein